MIKLKTYPIINNLTLTNELLISYIETFWSDVFNNIKDTSHLMLMCKVQFTDESKGYRTQGHLRKVNFTDKELFIEYLSGRLSLLNDSYITLPISNITFSYIIKNGPCNDQDRALLHDLSDKTIPFHNFNNMNLPISMDPTTFGTIRLDSYFKLDEEMVHRYIVINGNKTYEIDVCKDGMINRVTILGNFDLSWVDTKISDNIFKREIKKSTIYFMDGVKVLRKQELPAKPFKKLNVDKSLINDFYTLDIETIKESNGKLVPYLICAYDGSKYITSYGINQLELFSNFFNKLISNISASNTTIYAHNLSGFDGIFLLKQLLKYGEVIPLIFNGKLMSIKLIIKGNKKSENKTIIFKDSYLLLPLSLRKLCKAFGITAPKGHFPFNLTNINYSGVFPQFEHWTGITLEEYGLLKLEFKHRLWNFQLESTKYCKLDCQCLHEILVKFNELIFHYFKINIHTPLTLPSLAMKIYKTHFMPENSIYQILGKPEQNIRESYTGGAVDVYIPHNRVSPFFSYVATKFNKLFYYDVNSLYPFAMLNPMPHDLINPKLIDLSNRSLDSFFGFAEVEVTCPDSMKRPVLPFHMNGKTIYPVGIWKDVYFSEELKAVIKLGYTIKLIRGYEFTKVDLFTKYVNTFYEIKRTSSGSEKAIAKWLLNNLYGYFGRKQINIITQNVKNDNLEPILLTRVVKSITAINEDYSTVLTYSNINYKILDKLNNELHNNIENFHSPIKSNVAIAAAVTAYARIQMIPYKIDPNTLYTDTDSIFTLAPIDPNLIGDQLGQMKDEMNGKVIKEALFIAPKKYGYYYIDDLSNKIEKSVFAGVPRNSLTFEEINNIFEGNIRTKNVSNRFFKHFNTLNIDIKDTFITIKNNNDKILLNNEYLPIKLNTSQSDLFGYLYNKIKNLINKTFKIYFK